MIDKPIEQFLDELASKAPTPGGGSAAAIMGAMGAALVGMVCNLTLGKKGYESVAGEMQQLLDEAAEIRARLSDLVQADIVVFGQVMAAYRLPKETEADVASRGAAIQAALRAATEVPLDCARLCARVVRLSQVAADHGNRNAVSDAGAAVMAAYAALKCAALNVYINVGSLVDQDFVKASLSELEGLLNEYEPAVSRIFEEVKARL